MRTEFQRRVLAVAVGVVLLGSATAAQAGSSRSTGSQAVIVQGVNAAAAVRATGGTTSLALDLIGGVAASVPTSAIGQLQAQGLIVSPDRTARVASGDFSGSGTDASGSGLSGSELSGSGTDSSGSSGADGGHGVAVALVDTGVAQTPALDGRLVRGPDFSGEQDGLDHYGHGTFMAGVIAGDGSGSPAGGPVHRGIAPGATVVSIKVAGADGSTSFSKVIAGIGWAVVHQDDLKIRGFN